jgi:NAD(P)-dependent dehydrogenase (short-subunit alcohol dehydrogenase family)
MNEARAVLISGASSGIGRATALLLDQAGYRVFAGYRREADADSLRAEASDRLTPVRLDVTDPGQIAAAVALVSDETDQGRTFAAVVGNAGIHSVCPTAYIPIDRFRAVIEVNLIGHLGLIQACMPMLRRGRGRIASITSCNANLSVPYCAAYSAAKVGANYMLHALRRELRSFGIRVSIIEPGMIETPLWDDALETIDRNMADMERSSPRRWLECNRLFLRCARTRFACKPSPRSSARRSRHVGRGGDTRSVACPCC